MPFPELSPVPFPNFLDRSELHMPVQKDGNKKCGSRICTPCSRATTIPQRTRLHPGWLAPSQLAVLLHPRLANWLAGCLAGFVAGGWLPVCLWIKQGVSCSPGWVGSLAGCSRGWLAGFVAARGLMGGQPSHWHSGGHRDRNRHGNRGSANRACDASGRRRNNSDNNVNNNNAAAIMMII